MDTSETPPVASKEILNEGIASVYHFTSAEALDGILKEGLKAGNRHLRPDPILQESEAMLDKYAPASIRRTSGVFASTEPENIGFGHGNYVVEIEVPTEKAYVLDAETVNQILIALEHSDRAKAESLAKHYWDRMISLQEYHSAPQARQGYVIPEVLIPVEPGSTIPTSSLTIYGEVPGHDEEEYDYYPDEDYLDEE